MALTSILLEFSPDPLSDTSPSWQNVTSDLKTIEWWAGIDREGDEPKPGGATIRLKNTNRRWEPDFEAGQFFPNITTGRRFRLTLNDGGGSTQEGLWYVSDIAIDYPAGTGYSEVTLSCSDGCEVLALDSLPLMDPPDADSYADVVAFDEPWGYWRLGDPEGTKARVNIVTQHWRVRGRRLTGRYRMGQRDTTRSPAEGVAGPAGVYKNTPALGAEGLILGDLDTAVTLTGSQEEYVDIEADDDSFQRDLLTVECWVKIDSLSNNNYLIGGPTEAAGNDSIFNLRTTVLGNVSFGNGAGTTTAGGPVTADAIHHIVGTYDGAEAKIYVDGVLIQSSNVAFPSSGMPTPAASPRLSIGRASTGGSFVYADATTVDEVAVYEHVLSAERVLAHYVAGSARGWSHETAGTRIADIATHALWSEASIQTTGRDVMPQFKHGQAKLEEIGELAHAEGPRTMFFFNGAGDPVYLGHEWQASSATYNTVQATLGDNAGEVGYEAIELVYDNETYNEVTASHESGEAATASDTTAQTERGRRANTEYTDVLLMEHVHVESLANAVLAFYKDPALRPVSVTVNGADTTRLGHILERDIGHLVRVKKSGESGARIDRAANIIGKRKTLTADKHLVCTWTLSRGINAGAGLWQAGVAGFSEAGSTTVAA